MSATIILALLGMGFFAVALSDQDDVVEETEADEAGQLDTTGTDDGGGDGDGTSEPAVGQEFVFDGSDLLTGTEGNDTVTSDDDRGSLPDQTVEIQLLGGDDLADIEVNSNPTEIYGGDGDDTITGVGGVESELFGEAGDDSLIATEIMDIYGGEGDDYLGTDITDGGQLPDRILDGGLGNDTIEVTAEIGYDKTDFYGADITGGEGADEIRLDLEMNFFDLVNGEATSDEPTSTTTAITLLDFDPTEDSLMIEINPEPGNEARTFETIERSTTGNDLILSFAATETLGAHTATIRLGEDVDVNLDDIVIVQN